MSYLYITSGYQLIRTSLHPKKYYGSIDILFDENIINILLGIKNITVLQIEDIINNCLALRSLMCIYDCPLYPLIDNTVFKIQCINIDKLALETNIIVLFIIYDLIL